LTNFCDVKTFLKLHLKAFFVEKAKFKMRKKIRKIARQTSTKLFADDEKTYEAQQSKIQPMWTEIEKILEDVEDKLQGV
jgi:molecular chaperone DnaK (HSP70)